jgi:inorganic pyrophosphatase
MTLIRRFITNKYVLFVAPSVIMNSIGGFYEAIYINKYEPDTNITNKKLNQIGIDRHLTFTFNKYIIDYYCIECFKKDDN